MKSRNYVVINNRAYDPVTGLPINNHIFSESVKDEVVEKKQVEARGIATPKVHMAAQRSQTLSRRYIKSPLPAFAPAEAKEAALPNFSPMNIQQVTIKKSEAIQKIPSTPIEVKRHTSPARPAEAHPVARRAATQSIDISAPRRQRAAAQQKASLRSTDAPVQQLKEQKSLKPAHVLKNEAIFEAMNKEVADKKQRRTKNRKTNRWARFVTLATSSLAIVMLAGYLTYLNMPNLSIRMAAVQSGVNAKYPGYRPDGYALRGPISFRDGEVSMQFAYANSDRNFTIKQEASNWDSAAVKEFVSSQYSSATTTTANGLTIYTYENNAAWVNGGILYTIEGNAPLSSYQVQRIATSM